MRATGIELLQVPLSGYRQHIDGVMTMIDVNTVLLNPLTAPYPLIERLNAMTFKIIELDPEDHAFTVNCLAVGPGRIVMSAASQRTLERLDSEGMSVIPVPFENVYRGGGGIHCSTAPLVRDRIGYGPKRAGVGAMASSVGARERIKSALKRTLVDLSRLHGVSGFEQSVVRYTQTRLAEVADRVETDHYGNVAAFKEGLASSAPRLMISAHMDEIGFIVKAVEPNGYLGFDRIGGAGDALLSCRTVDVNGQFGLIGSVSGHLGSPEQLERVTPLKELYIDVGAASAQQVAAMGIRIGDPVSFLAN